MWKGLKGFTKEEKNSITIGVYLIDTQDLCHPGQFTQNKQTTFSTDTSLNTSLFST